MEAKDIRELRLAITEIKNAFNPSTNSPFQVKRDVSVDKLLGLIEDDFGPAMSNNDEREVQSPTSHEQSGETSSASSSISSPREILGESWASPAQQHVLELRSAVEAMDIRVGALSDDLVNTALCIFDILLDDRRHKPVGVKRPAGEARQPVSRLILPSPDHATTSTQPWPPMLPAEWPRDGPYMRRYATVSKKARPRRAWQ